MGNGRRESANRRPARNPDPDHPPPDVKEAFRVTQANQPATKRLAMSMAKIVQASARLFTAAPPRQGCSRRRRCRRREPT